MLALRVHRVGRSSYKKNCTHNVIGSSDCIASRILCFMKKCKSKFTQVFGIAACDTYRSYFDVKLKLAERNVPLGVPFLEFGRRVEVTAI